MKKPHAHNFIDLTGKIFGRLSVVAFVGKIEREALWLCQCVCGNTKAIRGSLLRAQKTQSCGCISKEVHAARMRDRATHNQSYTPEYKSYVNAQHRCTNPNAKFYAYYGGRGIEFRFSSFEEFYAHIGPRPTVLHSLDRTNNNGHYEIGNVRWATKKEQMNNRRSWKQKRSACQTQA